ncbi:MAG: T9SS type A sorting domain-containing protein [bacterium]
MEKFTCFNERKRAVIRIALLSVLIAVIANVNLYSQYKRNVVFEEFTEVWCPSCAYVAPILLKWLDNHPDYIPITYYSHFSVNGVADSNATVEYKIRSNFYAVPFYPYAKINAVNAPNISYPGFPTDTTAMNSIIDTMTTTTPVKVVIDFTNNGATGNVKVDLTSDVDLNNKYMYVFIVEKYHKYAPQSNGLSEFHHIMRQIIPKNGEKFSIKAGETLHYEYDYAIPGNLNYDLYASVIVQDNSTKYIYQSESVFKPAPNSVNEDNSDNNITIAPNPVSENIDILLNSSASNITRIDIYDIMGNKLNSIDLQNTQNKISLVPTDNNGNNLPDGVYYIKVQTATSVYYKKFIIKR